MDNSLVQIFGAIMMLVAVGALIFAWRDYLVRNSERRMLAMLDSIGIDPAIASSGDFEGIMHEVRQRCRHCQTEDVCEQWLKGEETGDNDFCPNARVFEILEKYSSAAGQQIPVSSID